MEEVMKFLKECGVYYLATVENGEPRVRPFGTAEIFEGKLYIQTGKGKDCYKQMIADPHIEICAFANGKWVRIRAEVSPDDRVEAKKDMLDKNPGLRRMYDENDDNTIVLYLHDAVATFASFTEAPYEVRF